LLPKENIIPTGEEAFNAVKYFGDFLLGNKGIETDLLHELHQGMPFEVTTEQPELELKSELVVEEATYDNEEANWELRRRRRR
jgi:extracellular matrix protein 14